MKNILAKSKVGTEPYEVDGGEKWYRMGCSPIMVRTVHYAVSIISVTTPIMINGTAQIERWESPF